MEIQQGCETMNGDISTIDGAKPHPSVKETALEREEIQSVVNTMPTSNRIPYNNGYDDFFFGWPQLWGKMPITDDISEEEKQDLMGISDNNGVPVCRFPV